MKCNDKHIKLVECNVGPFFASPFINHTMIISSDDHPWFVGHDWSDNYCHWLFDCLSDVWFIRNTGLTDFSLVLFEHQKRKYIDESIEAIGLKCIRDKKGVPFTIDKIIRDYNVVINPWRHTGYDHPDVIRGWNSIVGNVEKTCDILLIRRGGPFGDYNDTSRNIVNTFQLLESFSGLRVRTVIFEELSFKDQVQTVASAKAVIGVSGAGLANLAFATPGTVFVELQCLNQGGNRFKSIADTLGLVYKLFRYPKYMDTTSVHSWCIKVDVKEISEFVRSNLHD